MKQKIISRTAKYFWRFIKNHKFSFFLAAFAQICVVIGGFILVPYFLKEFIDLISNYSGTDRLELSNDLLRVFIIIFALDIASFWIFGRIFDFSIVYFESRAKRDLEFYCFQKLQNQSFDFFANNFIGSLVSKIKRFSSAFERIMDILLFQIIPNSIRFAITIAIIFHFARNIGLFLVIWIFVYFIIIFSAIIKWKVHLDRKAASMDSQMTGALADAIGNITTIKMFAREKFENQKYFIVLSRLFKARKKSWNGVSILNIFQSIMTTLMIMFSLYFMMRLWVQNQLTVGTIVLIQAYILQINSTLWELGRILKDFYTALMDSEEMIDILEEKPLIQDKEIPEKCKINKGKIEFKKVHFSYEDKNKVFADLDLTIEAGKHIGLVGESGAGKTTITKLILRFADISSGNILIDGQSIYNISQCDLRNNISFVPQEPILFHRSLTENIQYGDLEAAQEDIIKAAKRAHAHEFIQKTPMQYKTYVGERGIKLSGGERQRIAIARAILKNAPIIILDEATSALDSNAEKLVQDALEKLIKGRTTLVIAHRLSTLRKMDEIIVFDQGRIIERGSHYKLIRQDGKYACLWSHQAGGFIQD